MAKDGEATLTVKVKEKGAKILDKFVITLGDITNIAKAVGNAFVSLGQKIFDASLKASEFKEVKKAFTSLANSQGEDANRMLNKMRELSLGTISDLKLMKNANTALLLGLPVDKFGDMLQIARASSKATGQSMEFMLQSIVVGLGRGSKLILDNLGIIVDTNAAYEEFARTVNKTASELTDAQKKQAFINKAMEVGKKNADILGSSQLSLVDRVAKANASLENLTVTMGNVFGPMVSKVTIALGEYADAFNLAFKSANRTKVEEMALLIAKLNMRRSAMIAMGQRLGKSEEEVTARLDAQIAKLQMEVDAEQRAQDKKLEQQKIHNELMATAKAEAAILQAGIDESKAAVEQQNQTLYNTALKDDALRLQVEKLDAEIANENSAADKTVLIEQKKQLRLKAIKDQAKKEEAARSSFAVFMQSEEVKATQTALGTISSLQTSHSKELRAIGQIAATANVIMNTAVGVSDAWKVPFLGPILAPLVIAAGAAQIAKINSAPKLADGGIVTARPGGTTAIIGEGGRDEAVIPLDDSLSLSSNVTINVGAFMGSQDDARQFAIMVDAELLNLRKNNESVSFDQRAV